jgi:hypothetical protein
MRDLSNRLETCNIQKREVECSGHSHGFLFLYRNFQSPIRTEYGDEAKGSADIGVSPTPCHGKDLMKSFL